MNGYRALYNQQAIQAIDKLVLVPDDRLAIGTGEELSPLPATVVYPTRMLTPTIPDINTVAYEQASIDGYAQPISDKDFPKDNYFGEAIGGM